MARFLLFPGVGLERGHSPVRDASKMLMQNARDLDVKVWGATTASWRAALESSSPARTGNFKHHKHDPATDADIMANTQHRSVTRHGYFEDGLSSPDSNHSDPHHDDDDKQ